MLLINVEVKKAYRLDKENGDLVNIGNGIFATEFIPKGSVVYRDSIFSQIFTNDQVESMPKVKKDWIHKYATYKKDDDNWFLCTDDARLWNHDDNANCVYDSEESLEMTTTKDINIGEELTCNYTEFCDHSKAGNFGFEIL